MTSGAKPVLAAASPSAKPPSCAGSTRTLSVLGGTAAGFSPAAPTSPARLAVSWASTTAPGKGCPCETTTLSSPLPRKPAFRCARAPSHLAHPPGQPSKVEREYKRCGAWAYPAALDVHRSRLLGRNCCHANCAGSCASDVHRARECRFWGENAQDLSAAPLELPNDRTNRRGMKCRNWAMRLTPVTTICCG